MMRIASWMLSVGALAATAGCTPTASTIRCGAGTYLEDDECLPARKPASILLDGQQFSHPCGGIAWAIG